MNFQQWITLQEANHDHLKKLIEELPKFRTAKDILDSVSLEDHEDLSGRFDFAQGDNKKLLNFKYKNAKKTGLLDDILENGITQPLEIHVDDDENQTLTQGHHRLAIALKHFPNKPIPVKYWHG
jgi:hypothetical protein